MCMALTGYLLLQMPDDAEFWSFFIFGMFFYSPLSLVAAAILAGGVYSTANSKKLEKRKKTFVITLQAAGIVLIAAGWLWFGGMLMGLTGYLLLLIMAAFGVTVWFVVRSVQQKKWLPAVLAVALFIGLVVAIYLALGELISRM